MDYDSNRKKINKILKMYNIHNTSEKYNDFVTFILKPENSIYLQSFMIICSGFLPVEEVKKRLDDMIIEMKFIDEGNYTFRELFNIDKEWEEYFKENAYPNPSGQRREYEKRRGVNKEYVDDIMKLKNGPPKIPMEKAIYKSTINRINRKIYKKIKKI